jgi:hypothetical protein
MISKKYLDLMYNFERMALEATIMNGDETLKWQVIQNYKNPSYNFKIKDYRELAFRLGFIDSEGNVK